MYQMYPNAGQLLNTRMRCHDPIEICHVTFLGRSRIGGKLWAAGTTDDYTKLFKTFCKTSPLALARHGDVLSCGVEFWFCRDPICE